MLAYAAADSKASSSTVRALETHDTSVGARLEIVPLSRWSAARWTTPAAITTAASVSAKASKTAQAAALRHRLHTLRELGPLIGGKRRLEIVDRLRTKLARL